jgi:uncharacterized RDD family membrane protein YckC
MKCPKCGYLGFEDVERCRNCGYDFSLNSPQAFPDVTIRRDTRALTPLDDLSLLDGSTSHNGVRMSDIDADVDRMLGTADASVETDSTTVSPASNTSEAKPAVSHGATGTSATSSPELPLFGQPIPDDQPLITRASPPRAPLAVRRATPDVPKVRTDAPRIAALDFAPDEVSVAPPAVSPRASIATPTKRLDNSGAPPDAGVVARLVAVAIDLIILAAIDVVVIYFTMQICGLSAADFDVIPKGPLIAFLLVQNGGYLVAFTAGGQTLGKMVAGIRVVAAQSDAELDLGRAFLRTFMWVLLAVPAGLGFLSAIVSRDHRGLHDRFAGTRVVRASA